MALLQVRDVPEPTVRALKEQAAERGLTVSSALRGLVLGEKLDEQRLDEAVEDFGSLRIRRYQMTELLGHVLRLRDDFTTHDAAYVVLAQALDAPLVTSDLKMKEAEKFGIDVRVLRSS
ncbi:type II toxin-antitoxin system VapC family toxin [Planomonospora sp. ID82291]|uniref:type II toxin-antitoxin system VapC family toxin n=1 Tax=Planomonospora sp. ID82291 TaxID=2738136 RepID=UPI0018C43F56|nr:type II toxin-antitoxin system VapC family toxin [Planomonospora sp. ID82291]MBG0813571.1 type II toxin-antitoxin system VapC family toxin [Planomonospora sp. ID82291]